LIKNENTLDLILPVAIALVLLIVLWLFSLNVTVFYRINLTSQWLGMMWANLTILGDGLIIAVLLLPFLRKRPDLLWAMLWTAIVFNIVLHSMKSGFNFPRPPQVLPTDTFYIIGPEYHFKSFPSGHTSAAFAYAGVVAFGIKRRVIRFLLFALALLVGFSRIGVGVHWPTDVCAGLIVGWAGAWLGWWISKKISIGTGFVFQIIIGILLIVSAFVLLVDYDTHYPQAEGLRYVIGIATLVWGIVNFVVIWRHRFASTSAP